jgi:hypothetical protein
VVRGSPAVEHFDDLNCSLTKEEAPRFLFSSIPGVTAYSQACVPAWHHHRLAPPLSGSFGITQGQQRQRGLVCRQAQDIVHLLILEGPDHHRTQPKGLRLQVNVLCGMPDFDMHVPLGRRILSAEFSTALQWADELGLDRLDQRHERC